MHNRVSGEFAVINFGLRYFTVSVSLLLASCGLFDNEQISTNSSTSNSWLLGTWRVEIDLDQNEFALWEFFPNGKILSHEFFEGRYESSHVFDFQYTSDGTLEIHRYPNMENIAYSVIYIPSENAMALRLKDSGEEPFPALVRVAETTGELVAINTNYLIGKWSTDPSMTNEPGVFFEFNTDGTLLFYRDVDGEITDTETVDFSVQSPSEIEMKISYWRFESFQVFAPSPNRIILYAYEPHNNGYWHEILDLHRVE